ncbi:MAG: hypothetical protein AAB198_03005, partial [Actinomycetota bacterium]
RQRVAISFRHRRVNQGVVTHPRDGVRHRDSALSVTIENTDPIDDAGSEFGTITEMSVLEGC